MGDLKTSGEVKFHEATDFSFPRIKSLKLANVTYQDECVDGDIILTYEFNGDHDVRQHSKIKLNEVTLFGLGPLQAKAQVWLSGPEPWLGLTLGLGQFRSPEFKMAIDVSR